MLLAFSELLFGIRWQKQLDALNKEQMREEALYLWQHSGFPAFLNSAIKTLVSEAPHRALRTALQTTRVDFLAAQLKATQKGCLQALRFFVC